MLLVTFFASSTAYGSTKNLLSLPFQAPVFFGLTNRLKKSIFRAFASRAKKETKVWIFFCFPVYHCSREISKNPIYDISTSLLRKTHLVQEST